MIDRSDWDSNNGETNVPWVDISIQTSSAVWHIWGWKRNLVDFLSDGKLAFMVPTSPFVTIEPVPPSSHDKVILVLYLFFYTSKCVLSKKKKFDNSKLQSLNINV